MINVFNLDKNCELPLYQSPVDFMKKVDFILKSVHIDSLYISSDFIFIIFLDIHFMHDEKWKIRNFD